MKTFVDSYSWSTIQQDMDKKLVDIKEKERKNHLEKQITKELEKELEDEQDGFGSHRSLAW